MRRGCRVHYRFFNLGGAAHKIGVRRAGALPVEPLWQPHRVRFVAINFEPVVGEILEKVDDGPDGRGAQIGRWYARRRKWRNVTAYRRW